MEIYVQIHSNFEILREIDFGKFLTVREAPILHKFLQFVGPKVLIVIV